MFKCVRNLIIKYHVLKIKSCPFFVSLSTAKKGGIGLRNTGLSTAKKGGIGLRNTGLKSSIKPRRQYFLDLCNFTILQSWSWHICIIPRLLGLFPKLETFSCLERGRWFCNLYTRKMFSSRIFFNNFSDKYAFWIGYNLLHKNTRLLLDISIFVISKILLAPYFSLHTENLHRIRWSIEQNHHTIPTTHEV